MIVFMFLYCSVTSHSYITCSTVQYSTNCTVNATLPNGTLLNGTLIHETHVNAMDEAPKATMKRRCVIPESELKDLLQSECFVDKSLIIKDFLNMEPHIASVTAPRRFGKTVNLKMLKSFLQAENGLTTSKLTDNCSLFIKYNLNIFKWNNTFFHLHCGKYPVIYINFKKITGNSYKDVIGAFRDVIRDLYLEHLYLRDSTRLNVNEKTFILRYARFYLQGTDADDRKVIDGFVYLSETLYYHFNKKPIVLIDDFDALVWLLLSRDSQTNYFPVHEEPRTTYLIKLFVSRVLENNKYIEKGLLNNCLQLSNTYVKRRSSIAHFGFLENHPLVKYYGLTENEVREKLNYFNILQTLEDVKHYYNGYKVQVSGDNIYNTWSVMNYLQTEHLEDYWIATAGLHNIREMFLKNEVRILVSYILYWKNITIKKINEFKGVMGWPHIKVLQYVMETNRECTYSEAETFILFLADYGYFNPTRISRNLVSVNVPNNEIYQHLYKQHVASGNL